MKPWSQQSALIQPRTSLGKGLKYSRNEKIVDHFKVNLTALQCTRPLNMWRMSLLAIQLDHIGCSGTTERFQNCNILVHIVRGEEACAIELRISDRSDGIS